ncbi:UDP-GalNAc:beta-1,3-N-acetylgalactosaminyltransferase 2-like isoform X2 [Watersipora subatra]|uniref:UDP-GalNAc:beta-1, 3-N-acetylgalactosaminyltransferase 2-like isoform X2 n=1 Tax=Watersipora subatra TaxID=2589382 RepID=UPI00355B8D75
MTTGFWMMLSLLVALLSLTIFTVERKEVPKLVVLIISARNNHAQRKALRETWMKSTIPSGVKVMFVMGEACTLHPNDRKDVHSCEQLNIDYSDEVMEAWTRAAVDGPELPVTTEFKFTVLYPIMVTELSVVNMCRPSTGRAITVSLYDRVTQTLILREEIIFRDGTLDIIQEGVASVTLPKGFEGLISLNDTCEGLRYTSSELYCSSALICIREITQDIPIMGFSFQLTEKLHLSEFLLERELRQSSWNAVLQKHEELIVKERLLHNDILLTNNIDVYRNLPDKVLEAISRVVSELQPYYIMKTDDDCFVNISKIWDKILKLEEQSVGGKIWIGNFRRNWALDDFGKWAEHGFTGVTYPYFACGSGYIISAEVANWLRANKEHLHCFQGEDVSLGIWLSPLSIVYYHDEEFSCSSVDTDDMFKYATVSELSSQSLYKLYDHR